MSEARVTQAQNRKRACCSQPKSSTRTKRKPHAGKKMPIQLPIRVPLRLNTVDTADANASASPNTTTNTADTSVSTSTAAPTSKTSGEKDAKIRQRKALNELVPGFFTTHILFHSAINISNSTRTTIFNPIDNNQHTLLSLPRDN